MVRVGVNIQKTTSFRGVQQPFGNTYYYETALPVDTTIATALIDNIVSKERPMHSSTVSFTYARCWTAGGTKQENNMITQKALTGTGGAATPLPGQDRERAFLVRFRAGRDTRGNPVYLRKWWHLNVGFYGGASIRNSDLENTSTLQQQQRTQLETDANQFKNISALPGDFELVSEKGRKIDGGTQAHPYLEHRQLGDQWRG